MEMCNEYRIQYVCQYTGRIKQEEWGKNIKHHLILCTLICLLCSDKCCELSETLMRD